MVHKPLELITVERQSSRQRALGHVRHLHRHVLRLLDNLLEQLADGADERYVL